MRRIETISLTPIRAVTYTALCIATTDLCPPQGWVIPVSGTLRMVQGSVYKWSVRVEKKCSYRPQLQVGWGH